MTVTAFDGSSYRREVLAALRERDPSEVDDLFWLANVPRELDDNAAITERLSLAKGFLNKEKTRQRQAAVATAVLGEWPRVQATLTDPGARNALRTRLASTPSPDTGTQPTTRRHTTSPSDPAGRRRRQIAKNLAELARLRAEPDIAVDLYAFLGLPVGAPAQMISERLERVDEVNRRRRPDRERTLVDELLVQARETLVVGDPDVYMRGLVEDVRDEVIGQLLAGDEAGARAAHDRALAEGVLNDDLLAGLKEPARTARGPVPASALGLGVWCQVCGEISPTGAHSCAKCRGPGVLTCPSCQAQTAVDRPACERCGASLDAAREPLRRRREQREVEGAELAKVDALPADKRPQALADLARRNPDWTEVRRRMASSPPEPVQQVTVGISGGEAHISWPTSGQPGIDGYLVERRQGGTSRVLGRTGVTTWTDSDPSPGVEWTVKVVRGESVSRPVVAQRQDAAPRTPAAPPPEPELNGVRAQSGVPVEIRWSGVDGEKLKLERVDHRPGGPVTRMLQVSGNEYVDRHVARGRRYEYRLSALEPGAPAHVLDLEAGTDQLVRPGASGKAGAPAPAPTAPPAPQAAPAPTLGIQIKNVGVKPGDGSKLLVTWQWPPGITEAWVAWGESPPQRAGSEGRKVTNVRYALDGGGLLEDVGSGSHIAVFAGRRAPSGQLEWGDAGAQSRVVAP